MFITVEEFVNVWKNESASTLKLLVELTDESLKEAVLPGERPLGLVAWHIVKSVPEIANRIELPVEGPATDAPLPATAKEIHDAYEKAAKQLGEMMSAKWTDEDLKKVDDMYGEQWARGFTLGVLLLHEVHHRGQMTVLMRKAGLRVRGCYGPAREEWVNYGMPPQE